MFEKTDGVGGQKVKFSIGGRRKLEKSPGEVLSGQVTGLRGLQTSADLEGTT